MKELTTKQASRKYLKHNGVYCPFCESSNLVTGDTESIDGILKQGVCCENCGAEWTDVYKLSGMQFDI